MSEQLPPPDPSPSPVDDGHSPVAGAQRRELSIGTKLGLIGLIGVITLDFVWFNALYSHRKANDQQKQSAAIYAGSGESFNAPPALSAKPTPRIVSAFGAYTSGSRHREQSFIVTSEGAERAEIVARRPLGDRRQIMRADVLKNIIRNFSKQPIKETALDMLDRAANLRRGTIRTVQASLHGMEARAARQKEPSTLGRRFAVSRLNRALESCLPGFAERLQRQAAGLTHVATMLAARANDIIQRRCLMPQTESEYWRATRDARIEAEAVTEQTEARNRAKQRGSRRRH